MALASSRWSKKSNNESAIAWSRAYQDAQREKSSSSEHNTLCASFLACFPTFSPESCLEDSDGSEDGGGEGVQKKSNAAALTRTRSRNSFSTNIFGTGGGGGGGGGGEVGGRSRGSSSSSSSSSGGSKNNSRGESKEMAEELYQQGVYLLDEGGRVTEALGRFKEAISHDANHTSALFNVANIMQQQSSSGGSSSGSSNATKIARECERLYRKVIRLKENDSASMYNLAYILMERAQSGHGQCDEAIELFRRVVENEHDDIDAHISLGIALKEANRFDEALSSYRRALAIDNSHAFATFCLAQGLHLRGRFEQAVKIYKKAVELSARNGDPATNTRALLGLSLCYQDYSSSEHVSQQNISKFLELSLEALSSLSPSAVEEDQARFEIESNSRYLERELASRNSNPLLHASWDKSLKLA